MTRWRLLPLTLAGVFLLLTGMVSVGSKVPAYTVEDQNERSWKLSNFSDKPVLYVLCDLEAYDHVDNWTPDRGATRLATTCARNDAPARLTLYSARSVPLARFRHWIQPL